MATGTQNFPLREAVESSSSLATKWYVCGGSTVSYVCLRKRMQSDGAGAA